MDSDTFRKELYETFKAKGIPDILKLQLRSSLVSELQSAGGIRKSPPQGDSLALKAANSLVYNHLQKCQYSYTLSVYGPEAGFRTDQVLSFRDLMDLLNITKDSVAYKKLEAVQEEDHSSLWNLIKLLLSCYSQDSVNNCTQTEFSHLSKFGTLTEKLEAVDEEYAMRHGDGDLLLSERLLRIQKDTERRCRAEYREEMQRMREVELSRIRMEEQEKYRQQLDQTRSELEGKHRERLAALSKREESSMETMRTRHAALERESYLQRQHILEQVDALRKREVALNKEADMRERNMALQEDKLKEMKKQLEAREANLNHLESTYEVKLQEEIRRIRQEVRSDYSSRLATLELNEARVSEETRRLNDDLASLDKSKQESRERAARVVQLELELEEARVAADSLKRQNDVHQERIKEMSDYHKLRQENILLRDELNQVKRNMDDVSQATMSERRMFSKAISEQGPSFAINPSYRNAATSYRESLAQEAGQNRPGIHSTANADNIAVKLLAQELQEVKASLNEQRHPTAPDVNPLLQDLVATPPPLANDDEYPNISSSSDDLPVQHTRTGVFLQSRVLRVDPEASDDPALAFLVDSKNKIHNLNQEADHLENRYKSYAMRLSSLARETYRPTDDGDRTVEPNRPANRSDHLPSPHMVEDSAKDVDERFEGDSLRTYPPSVSPPHDLSLEIPQSRHVSRDLHRVSSNLKDTQKRNFEDIPEVSPLPSPILPASRDVSPGGGKPVDESIVAGFPPNRVGEDLQPMPRKSSNIHKSYTAALREQAQSDHASDKPPASGDSKLESSLTPAVAGSQSPVPTPDSKPAETSSGAIMFSTSGGSLDRDAAERVQPPSRERSYHRSDSPADIRRRDEQPLSEKQLDQPQEGTEAVEEEEAPASIAEDLKSSHSGDESQERAPADNPDLNEDKQNSGKESPVAQKRFAAPFFRDFEPESLDSYKDDFFGDEDESSNKNLSASVQEQMSVENASGDDDESSF